MRFVILAAACFFLGGCSLIIDSDEYVGGDDGGGGGDGDGGQPVRACSVSACKSEHGASYTCDLLGNCVNCDVDGDGFASQTCLGLAGQELPFGDCDDRDAQIYPLALPTCGNQVSEACELPELLSNSGYAELGFSPWMEISEAVDPPSELAPLSLARTWSGGFVLVGANGSGLRLDRIFLRRDRSAAFSRAHDGEDSQAHFGPHMGVTSVLALSTNHGEAYLSVSAERDGYEGTRSHALYTANGQRQYPDEFDVYASIMRFDGPSSDHQVLFSYRADLFPGLVSISLPPQSSHQRVGIVGVRDAVTGADTPEEAVEAQFYAMTLRQSGLEVEFTLPIEDESPEVPGRVLSSGGFAAYMYKKTSGRWAFLIWRPDLDTSPNEGEHLLYETSSIAACLVRPKLIAAADGERVYVAYESRDDCDEIPEGVTPTVEGFSCGESGCAPSGESFYTSHFVSGAPYALTTAGGRTWLAYLDMYTPGVVRLVGSSELPLSGVEADVELLRLEEFGADLTLDDLTLTSNDDAEGGVEIGVAVRLRHANGQLSTHFRSLRGCETL